MLLNDAKQIEASIADLRDLREMARSVDAYQTRAGMLEKPAFTLRSLVAILEEFRAREITVDTRQASASAQALALRVREVSAGFEENPESILTSDESLRRDFWEVLSNGAISVALKEALTQAWMGYVDSLLPTLNRMLLDSLSRVPGLQSEAAQVRGLLSQVQGFREHLPQMNTDFTRLHAVIQALDESWRNLGAGTPNDVLSFLQAAIADGARLGDLTSTVQEWLERHGLIQDLRVVFRSQAQASGRHW